MSEFDHWLPLHVGDFVSDTLHLTTLQKGVYLMLIMHYWKRRELPNDDRVLAHIAGLSLSQFQRVGDAVKALFTVSNCQDCSASNCQQDPLQNSESKTRLTHSKIERELAKAKAVSEARKISGAKGLQKRYGQQSLDKKLAIADTRARVPSPLEEEVSAPTEQIHSSSGALPARDERSDGARALAAPPQPQADQEPWQPPSEEQKAAVAETLKAITGYAPRPQEPERSVAEQLAILRSLNGSGDSH